MKLFPGNSFRLGLLKKKELKVFFLLFVIRANRFVHEIKFALFSPWKIGQIFQAVIPP